MSNIFSLAVASSTGYAVDDTVTGSVSGATGVITKISGNTLYITMSSTLKYFIDSTDKQDGENISNGVTTTQVTTALGLISLVQNEDIYEMDSRLEDYVPKNECDWRKKIERAWDIMITDMLAHGIKHDCIRMKHSDMPRFKNLHIFKCLELIFLQGAKDPEGIFFKLHQYWRNEYKDSLAGLQYDYDSDENGYIDEAEESTSLNNMRFIR